MIRNGLYLAKTRFLDGVEAYNRHVMVLRGGGGFYYTVGSYTCSGGKWKGEMTRREHSPIIQRSRFSNAVGELFGRVIERDGSVRSFASA
jgi:hypothetical protein